MTALKGDLALTLAPFVYEGVEFPGSETATAWGHDSAKHQGYLQRGQVSETTGQRARVFTVKVPLRNGLRWDGPQRLYPETYLSLREKLKIAEGFLTHPTYGLTPVHVDDVRETINPTQPDGIDLDITFTEQDGDAQELELALTGRAASTPSEAAVARAGEADSEAASLTLSDTTSLADEIGNAFDRLQEVERPYTEAAAEFAALTTSIRARADDPGAALATGHAYRAALSQCLSAVLDYEAEYLGAEEPETITLPETMSLARAAALAYGDPSRASELASRNRIPDPAFIPAGTVLVI